MRFSKRRVPVIAVAFILVITFILYRDAARQKNWRQAVGFGDVDSQLHYPVNNSLLEDRPSKYPYGPRPNFAPGVPKPPGSSYSKMIVCPKTNAENTDWMAEELPEWETMVYSVDNPHAELHPPKNKGHEVMVYLTFIIDNYDNLPDIVAFMHSHRYAWHNEEILDTDAVEMLRRMSPERVYREGYMNMRCIWAPGCPDWMHPGAVTENEDKQEETMVARSWVEIFPEIPVPDVLAQPCCAQFAVTRERIQAIPRSRYIYYRDWVLLTELSDYISGRVWEYLWHYIFTGQKVVCPREHVCFCDGFGLCFGGEQGLRDFFVLRQEIRDMQNELNEWNQQAQALEHMRGKNKNMLEAADLQVPPVGRDAWLVRNIQEKSDILTKMKEDAEERGKHPKYRAFEAGRPWKEGDGF